MLAHQIARQSPARREHVHGPIHPLLCRCGVCRVAIAGRGRFPRPLFFILFSWWWPFRKPSAVTLAADILEADDEAEVWKTKAEVLGPNSLINDELQMCVREDYSGNISFVLAGEPVPLTAWEDFVLWRSVRTWEARRDAASRKRARDKAAKTVKDILRKRKAA
jgi:hypothetical protein